MAISDEPAFPLESEITGKWNKRKYRIEKVLGEGSNGRVYLVRRGKLVCAMKIGFDSVSLQSEINVLQSLRKGERTQSRFYIEADDYMKEDRIYPFYVMKYIQGLKADEFIRRNGVDWIYPLISHLLKKLSNLHAQGWVFGDLKNENVLISEFGKAELIDYGGVTRVGNAVKQFTEIYDRGYWSAGSRNADEHYDLFSLGILLLQLTDPQGRVQRSNKMLPQNRDVDYLLEVTRTNPKAGKITPFLEKIFLGKLMTSMEAEADWKRYVHDGRPSLNPVHPTPWLTGFLAVSIIILAVTLYYTFQ